MNLTAGSKVGWSTSILCCQNFGALSNDMNIYINSHINQENAAVPCISYWNRPLWNFRCTLSCRDSKSFYDHGFFRYFSSHIHLSIFKKILIVDRRSKRTKNELNILLTFVLFFLFLKAEWKLKREYSRGNYELMMFWLQ